jgi:hypothetical protein
MMRWGWPSEQSRENWGFVFKGLQALAIVGGAIWALWTYSQNSREQQEAIRRELRKPYDEKQLSLYLEAARVLAHLSVSPDVQRAENEARFWELYWGELPFVEDKTVRTKMAAFCFATFGENRCGEKPDVKVSENAPINAAIDMSRTAGCLIRARWSPPITIKTPFLFLEMRAEEACNVTDQENTAVRPQSGN